MTDSNGLAIHWFRRDLRLEDNEALYFALKNEESVLPVFIFDKEILNKLEDKNDRRVSFIHHHLNILNHKLIERGSSLLCLYDDPLGAFKKLTTQYKITAVYTNHDYEPLAIDRDEKVKDFLQAKGIIFRTYKDQVIFEKNEVLKEDKTPYTVFTPYMRKWKSLLNQFYLKPYPVTSYLQSLIKIDPFTIPSLQQIGFNDAGNNFPPAFFNTEVIKKYTEQRDIPSIAGTSRLSVHLRFGTVSIRALVTKAIDCNEKWLNELIWREFYMMILYHFPHVTTRAFKPAYDNIHWLNDHGNFDKWCNGQTGYPIVDAGMRELNETGFMHNRVRMITASFLVKHLLTDWRWGEAYFAQKLLDFELSSNNGGWQWCAGSGCDAAPFFRIFNPYEQTKKFDSQLKYIKRWVPEFEDFNYPQPIVNHQAARARVLEVYKKALAGK